VRKPVFLREKILLLCIRFRYDTTVFPLDLLRVMYMYRGGVFQSHIPDGGEVYDL